MLGAAVVMAGAGALIRRYHLVCEFVISVVIENNNNKLGSIKMWFILRMRMRCVKIYRTKRNRHNVLTKTSRATVSLNLPKMRTTDLT